MYDQGKAVWPGPYCVPSGQSCLVRFVLCTIRTKLSGQVCIVYHQGKAVWSDLYCVPSGQSCLARSLLCTIRAKLSRQICIVYHQGKAVSPGLYCVPSGQNCLARSLLCTIRAKLSGQVCIVYHQGKAVWPGLYCVPSSGKAVWPGLYCVPSSGQSCLVLIVYYQDRVVAQVLTVCHQNKVVRLNPWAWWDGLSHIMHQLHHSQCRLQNEFMSLFCLYQVWLQSMPYWLTQMYWSTRKQSNSRTSLVTLSWCFLYT